MPVPSAAVGGSGVPGSAGSGVAGSGVAGGGVARGRVAGGGVARGRVAGGGAGRGGAAVGRGGSGPLGHGEHPQPPGQQRREGPVGLARHVDAGGEDRLRRPLGHDPVGQQRNRDPAMHVEGQVLLDHALLSDPQALGEHGDRHLHGITDPLLPHPLRRRGCLCRGLRRTPHGLLRARVRVAHRRRGAVAPTSDLRAALGRPQRDDVHLVLGQRAGLVGADEGGGAEGLHRFEPAHQRVARGHPLRADRQRERDCRKQPLGDQGDRDPDAEDEPVPGRHAEDHHQREEHDPHHGRDERDHAHEPADVALQRRGRPVLGGEPGDASQPGLRPRGVDDAGDRALHEEAAREDRLPRSDLARCALTSERGGVDQRALGGQAGHVGGDAVPRGEHHHVAGDDEVRGDLLLTPLAQHGGAHRQQVAQARGRALGPVLLHEREDPVDQDHRDDRHTERRHPPDERQQGGHPQQQREEVHELGAEAPPHGYLLGARQHVAPHPRQRLGRLGVSQAQRLHARCSTGHASHAGPGIAGPQGSEDPGAA